MKKRNLPFRDENGSALLVVVIIVPVLALLCMFASKIIVQDLNVTANDKCHRIAFYNGDGAAYGTAKLISLIGKSATRQAVVAGEGNAAPGIEYINSESSQADQAEYFRHLLTSMDSTTTTQDVSFIKSDEENDIGLESTVDMTKLGPGGVPAGGGAEFGSGAEGIGAQMNVVIFRIQSQGQSPCSNTTSTVVGDYWLITSKDGQTKGI